MNRPASIRSVLRSTLPTSPQSIAILGIDLLVVTVFFVVGLYHHQIPAWEAPLYTLESVLPFVITWVLISSIAGLYHPRVQRSYRQTLARVPIAWLIIVVLGSQIRATSYFPGTGALDFQLVTVFFGLLFVLPWRIFSVWLSRYASDNAASVSSFRRKYESE